jgi:ankyrin repeat protein
MIAIGLYRCAFILVCAMAACQVTAADNRHGSTETSEPSENFYRGVDQRQLQYLLDIAAVKNDVPTIIALCAAGADPNAFGREGSTALQISVRLGNVDALKALLKHGGRPDERSMMAAAVKGRMKAMKLLERYGGNIAQTDKDGCSTLHYAAEKGTLEMVQYLVERGVPINTACRQGETPLEWAKNGTHAKVVHYLTRMGAR